MNRRSLFLAPALFVLLGAQLAFGWGNAAHVYFARQLGTKYSPLVFTEMYGALLPDCFNLIMTEQGQYLSGLMHAADATVGPVWPAAKTPLQKALAFGFMTHYEGWAADYTAHIDYSPFTTDPPHEPVGYMIAKSYRLMPALLPVLRDDILLPAGIDNEEFAQGLAVALGHDLVETAIDLHVRRSLDRGVGLEMLIAAKTRPSNAGKLLADAYAKNVAETFGIPLKQASAFIIGAEKEYQASIVQYGMAFCLPEEKTIALLAQNTAPVAEMYIEGTYALQTGELKDVTVTPEQVARFIVAAREMLKAEGDVDTEIAATLLFVESGLREHGIRAPHGAFAFESAEESVQSDEVVRPPTTYALAQNTPNPFNPSTVIGFSVPDQAHVRLTVFNALGQEVATLVDEERPAGSYSVRWNAVNQPSGAYFYRIESGSFVQTKRMMLVK